ncbi:MAG: helix-turn-helix transcriptional regulator [Bradyrhizobium sp.]|nr:helix-turn-helix transcriptional regulator [Bradyrhizobium sp.]
MTGVIGVYHGSFGRVALFRTNQPVHEHAHPHVHALLKVEGKDGVYDVAGSPCPITDHRMVLVNPWVPHANWRDVGDSPITILALYLETGWLARDGSGHAARRPFKRPSGLVGPPVRSLVGKIAAMIAAGDHTTNEGMEIDIFELSQHVLNDNADMGLGPLLMRPVDHRVRKAVNLMRSDPTRPHRIDEVAHSVGLSRSHFFQQFREGMGMSPGVYSDTLRVEYAIEALISTDRAAGDIALDLGFSAPSHFSRFFKDKIGFAPQDYRRVAHQLSRQSAGAMIAPATALG